MVPKKSESGHDVEKAFHKDKWCKDIAGDYLLVVTLRLYTIYWDVTLAYYILLLWAHQGNNVVPYISLYVLVLCNILLAKPFCDICAPPTVRTIHASNKVQNLVSELVSLKMCSTTLPPAQPPPLAISIEVLWHRMGLVPIDDGKQFEIRATEGQE